MELKIVYLPVGELKPYERNARKHEDADIQTIVNSIKQFGFRDPIGIWGEQNIIVEGHGRLLAAQRLGMAEVPCIRLDDMTDEQRRAYALAHNRTAELSEWDFGILDEEIEKILDIDMSLFGLEKEEKETVKEDDYNPEPPKEPNAKMGDVYMLGRHRLMCGDSTSAADVRTLTDGAVMDMLLTDPPYNVDYEGAAGKIKNDSMDDGKFRQFLLGAFENAKTVLKPGGVFHIWYGENEAYNFRGACKDAGLTVRQQLVWVKSQATLGRQDFQHMYESVLTGDSYLDDEMVGNGYEPCLYGWVDGSGHRWYKKRKERDVLFFDKPTHSAEHPTMKPILLFDYEMRCNTKKGENVLDLFGGSGTTIMACEQNGRSAFVMEFDPKFVDVIIDRWETFTGRKAVLLRGSDSN